MSRKVRYVVASGCELGIPLSDGQNSFETGIVYTVESYDDFHRLIKHGDFEEVFDEVPVVEETPVKDEPVVDDEIIQISPNKKKGVSE